MAKDLLAGFAGGESDKLFETHGLDFLDREKGEWGLCCCCVRYEYDD